MMTRAKVFFASLGCDKNLVDTEEMLGLLQDAGFELTGDEREADVIVVNTCCFIGEAKEESIETILELAQYRQTGQLKALIVTGCLAERYRDEILREMPEVDAVVGTASYDCIVSVIRRVLDGDRGMQVFQSLEKLPQPETRRILTTGGHYAFLKIAEGCDKGCTYCVIPQVRGHYRSYPMERLLREAQRLAEQGVRELILVAQETTLYGVDLYGEKKLPELLAALSAIPGLRWIRVMYCYPEEITDELIAAVRDLPKVCHYLDIPVQHASDRILRRMGRRTSRAQLTDIIEKLRREIPDIVLRTTLMTGFPGETQEDFETLCEFVDEMEFDRLGVFAYSQEENTPAAVMPDQIPEEVKASRRDTLMEIQQDIAFEKAERQVGRILTVMVEGTVEDGSAVVCRTYMDAPEVDGYLFLTDGEERMTGEFVQVRVTGADEYDLTGEVTDEPA